MTSTGYKTPLQGEVAPHDHAPDLDALQKVVDAFDKAGIRVHFDVGPTLYQKTATQPGLKYSGSCRIRRRRRRHSGEKMQSVETGSHVCLPRLLWRGRVEERLQGLSRSAAQLSN